MQATCRLIHADHRSWLARMYNADAHTLWAGLFLFKFKLGLRQLHGAVVVLSGGADAIPRRHSTSSPHSTSCLAPLHSTLHPATSYNNDIAGIVEPGRHLALLACGLDS